MVGCPSPFIVYVAGYVKTIPFYGEVSLDDDGCQIVIVHCRQMKECVESIRWHKMVSQMIYVMLLMKVDRWHSC